MLGRHSRQSRTAQGAAAERVAALGRGSRRCGRMRTARAAQATACGKRRAHCATPLACHARQAGRGRCCRRAWAARRARVAWARAREPKAPAVRRGATQGAVWASGWLGHCRLSTFARQDVSAALLVATCGRARRRQFAHPPATTHAWPPWSGDLVLCSIWVMCGISKLGFRLASLPLAESGVWRCLLTGLGLGKLLAADQVRASACSPHQPFPPGHCRSTATHSPIPSPNPHPHRPPGRQSKRDGHDSKPEGAAFGAERGEAKRAPAVRQPEQPSRSRRAPSARDR